MKELKISALRVSILVSVSLFLVTLTFKNFFYYVPFMNGFSILGVFQTLSIIGWIALIAAPPLFFASSANWSRSKFALFVASVSTWTGATLLIKIFGLVTVGKLWANYLIVYPVMIYFEWVAPIFYILLGYQVFKSSSRVKTIKRKVVVEEEVEVSATKRSAPEFDETDE